MHTKAREAEMGAGANASLNISKRAYKSRKQDELKYSNRTVNYSTIMKHAVI